MASFVPLDRHKQHLNRIREYSVELGLRTHRPSALTAPKSSPHLQSNSPRRSTNNNYDNTSKSQYDFYDTVSECSNLPQCGDEDWWKLPAAPTRLSYEQKTKSVRISYSVNEIYGKAQISDTDAGHIKQSSPRRKDVYSERYKDIKTSRANTPPRAYAVEHSNNNHIQLNETQSEKFGFRDESKDHSWLQDVDRRSFAHPPNDSTAYFHSPPNHDIKFRTFEEAMRVYPSDDSDSDSVESLGSARELSARSPSSQTKHKIPPLDISSHRRVSDLSSTSIEAWGLPESLETAQVEKDANQVEEVSSPPPPEVQDSTSVDFQANTHSQQIDDEPEGIKEIVRSPYIETPCQSQEAPLTSCKKEVLQSDVKQRHASTPDSEPAAPIYNVPPIDLSHLSPKRSKSAGLARRSTSKSTNTKKILRTSTPAPTKNSLNTKQIAREIKFLVQKNPAEIASQIKRRVQSQTRSTPNGHQNNVSTIENHQKLRNHQRKNHQSSYYQTTDYQPHAHQERYIQSPHHKPAKPQPPTHQPPTNQPPQYQPPLQQSPVNEQHHYQLPDQPSPVHEQCNYKLENQPTRLVPTSYSEQMLEDKTSVPESINSQLGNRRTSLTEYPLLLSFRGYDRYIAMSPRIESGSMSIWQCLPEELWLIILSYLPLIDLHSFMRTCSDFNRISYDRSLWRSVLVTKKELSDDELSKIGHLKPRKLSIIQCSGVKLNGDMASNRGFKEMFTSLGTGLLQLSVASCVMPPLSGEALLHHAVLHCPNLIYLDLSWCNITNRDVELVAESFSNLSSLLLNGNQLVTDSGLSKLLTNFTTQLKQLEIQGLFKLTNQTLSNIGECSELMVLNIGQCHKFSSSRIATSLSQLSNLEVCNMKGLKQLKDACIAQVVKHCPSIENLVISQCSGLTPKSLVEISCGLASLRSLDVSSCKGCVNDASLCALLANCSKLVILDLSSTSVSNYSIETLARSCTHLRELKLNFCSISEAAIKLLLTNTSTLRRAQLYGLKNLQSAELNEINANVVVEN